MMIQISGVALILLVTHFYRYLKFKEEYRKNFNITSAIVLIVVIVPWFTKLVDLQIFTNLVLGLLIILIPLYFYFERPMYKIIKEARHKEIMDRSSKHRKDFD